MKSSESNPPVKAKPRQAEAGPEEEAFPEELMRLARPPRGITAKVKDGVLTIRRRWYVGLQAELINVLFGLKDGKIDVKDGQVGLNYGQMGLLGLFGLFGLFGLNGLLVGLFFGLVYLFVSLNSSIIRKPTALMAAGDVLQVKYFPRGPLASREIRTDMTHQIFVVAPQTWYTASEPFTVKARLHSGEHVVLFEGLTRPQAKFIEHRLEAFLGIANQRVEGEVED